MEQEQKPLTFDEILTDKDYQAEFDRRVNKAIETATNNAKSKWEEEFKVKMEKERTEAEKLANMVNISRKTWEESTEILKQNNILLHKSYYKGTSRHTTYGFDWENIEQGINYFINDKKQENCTESLEDEKDENNIEKDRRVIQLRRRIF